MKLIGISWSTLKYLVVWARIVQSFIAQLVAHEIHFLQKVRIKFLSGIQDRNFWQIVRSMSTQCPLVSEKSAFLALLI